jgi:hypothetical protein
MTRTSIVVAAAFALGLAAPVVADPSPVPDAGGSLGQIPAHQEAGRATRPIEAVSLHDGPFDMVAYYLPTGDGSFDVTATFVADIGADPMRIVMTLADGDDVAFALPGYPHALYRFAREGVTLEVSVSDRSGRVASAR